MTADTVGGVWTYAIELARGLAESGVRVTLATMGAPLSAAQCAEAAAVTGLRIEESTFKLEWMEDAEEDVARAGDWLRRLEQRHRPDLVHLNGYVHAALPWSVPVLVVAHSCVVTWWRAVHGGPPPSCFDRYTTGLRRGLAAATRLVAPSAAFLAAFEAAHGRAAPATVVPNGRDPARFRPAAKEAYFLSVGRLWDAAKNARALAEIAPRLPWPVRVAGDPSSPDGRTPDLPNLGLLGRCSPERVAELMARAAVYVLPARYEPFGLSILEAGLSGCALVLGDIPSLREIWDDAALYVAPDDPAELQEVLSALAADPGRCRALGERAGRRARRYSARAMVNGYRQIYRELLGAAAPARPEPLTIFA